MITISSLHDCKIEKKKGKMKEKKEKKEACILFLIAGRIIEKNPLGTHDRCLLFFVEIVLVSAPMC